MATFFKFLAILIGVGTLIGMGMFAIGFAMLGESMIWWVLGGLLVLVPVGIWLVSQFTKIRW